MARHAEVPPDAAPPAPAGLRARLGAFAAHAREPMYRSSYFLILNTAVGAFGGFLFWLLAARLAPPEDVGVASALVGAIGLLAMLAKVGLDVSLLQVVPSSRPERAASFVDAALATTTLLSALLALVFVLGTPWWSAELSFLRASPGETLLFAALTAVWTYGTLADMAFVAARRSEYAFQKNALYAALRVAALALLAGAWGHQGILLAFLAPLALLLAPAVLWWLPRALPGFSPSLRPRPGVLLETTRSSLANFVVALAAVVPLSVGSLVVLHRFGAADAAAFYVLWTFGAVAMMAPMAFGSASLVEMSRTRDLRVLFGWKPLAVTALGAAGALAAALLLLPLYGEAYAQALGPAALLPIVAAALPGYLLQARLAQFRAAGNLRALVLVPGLATALFVVALLLVPPGLAYVAASWLAVTLLGALLALAIPPGGAGRVMDKGEVRAG